jgi:hypothetical protein
MGYVKTWLTNLIILPRLPFALAALLVLSGCEQDSHQSNAVSNDSAIADGTDVMRTTDGSQGSPETNAVVNYGYYGPGNPGSVPVVISNSDSDWVLPVITLFSSNSLFTDNGTNLLIIAGDQPVLSNSVPFINAGDQPVWSNSVPYTPDYSFGGNGESGCSMSTPAFP